MSILNAKTDKEVHDANTEQIQMFHDDITTSLKSFFNMDNTCSMSSEQLNNIAKKWQTTQMYTWGSTIPIIQHFNNEAFLFTTNPFNYKHIIPFLKTIYCLGINGYIKHFDNFVTYLTSHDHDDYTIQRVLSYTFPNVNLIPEMILFLPISLQNKVTIWFSHKKSFKS